MNFDIKKIDEKYIHVTVSVEDYTGKNREACTSNEARQHLIGKGLVVYELIKGGVIDNKFDTIRELTYIFCAKTLDEMVTHEVILDDEVPVIKSTKKRRKRRTKVSPSD